MSIFGNDTVTYGKPASPSSHNLPFVTTAPVQASIDKAYLTWLEISKLLMAFPQRVQLVGDTVVFEGPVTIISPLSITRRFAMQSLVGIATGTCLLAFIALLISKGASQWNPLSKKLLTVAVVSLGCGGAIAGFYGTGLFLALAKPGVYFYNVSSFIP